MEHKELLYAFSLGCLSKNDFDIFVSILENNEPFAYEELGEFQNLAALLPAMLNIETPAPEVKDKVARKLYRLQEEIKKKKEEEQSSEKPLPLKPQEHLSPAHAISVQTQEDISSVFDEKVDEEIVEVRHSKAEEFESVSAQAADLHDSNEKEEINNKTDDDGLERHKISDTETGEFEVITSTKQSKEFLRPPQETQVRERLRTDLSKEKTFENFPGAALTDNDVEIKKKNEPLIEKPGGGKIITEAQIEPKKKSYFGTLVVVLLFLLLITVVAIAYFKIMEDIDGYKLEITNLTNRINEFQTKVGGDEALDRIMNSRGVYFAQLSSADFNVASDAKVFLSGESGEALFRISNLPPLSGKSVYNIWINTGSTFESLVSFNAEDKPFTIGASVRADLIKPGTEIKITEEISSGADRPGWKIILQGALR